MTKDQFRDRATHLIDVICSVPDDIWQGGKLMVRVAYRTETLIIGLGPPESEIEIEKEEEE